MYRLMVIRRAEVVSSSLFRNYHLFKRKITIKIARKSFRPLLSSSWPNNQKAPHCYGASTHYSFLITPHSSCMLLHFVAEHYHAVKHIYQHGV